MHVHISYQMHKWNIAFFQEWEQTIYECIICTAMNNYHANENNRTTKHFNMWSPLFTKYVSANGDPDMYVHDYINQM